MSITLIWQLSPCQHENNNGIELLLQHIAKGLQVTAADGTLLTPGDGLCEFSPESVIGSSLDSELMVCIPFLKSERFDQRIR